MRINMLLLAPSWTQIFFIQNQSWATHPVWQSRLSFHFIIPNFLREYLQSEKDKTLMVLLILISFKSRCGTLRRQLFIFHSHQWYDTTIVHNNSVTEVFKISKCKFSRSYEKVNMSLFNLHVPFTTLWVEENKEKHKNTHLCHI